jgi:hypothetical protein
MPNRARKSPLCHIRYLLKRLDSKGPQTHGVEGKDVRVMFFRSILSANFN